jgi:hypothetical protein
MPNQKPPTTALIAACDNRSARLFETGIAPGGQVHATEVASLSNAWEDFHEHGRPSRLGMGPSANAAQHFADEHREPEELARRFAREVVAWIARKGAELPGTPFHVFVAPRFLGYLREEIARSGQPLAAELVRGELSGLRAHEIAEHPRVQSLVPGARAEAPAARA